MHIETGSRLLLCEHVVGDQQPDIDRVMLPGLGA
jgi:hypothetical protein